MLKIRLTKQGFNSYPVSILHDLKNLQQSQQNATTLASDSSTTFDLLILTNYKVIIIVIEIVKKDFCHNKWILNCLYKEGDHLHFEVFQLDQ